MDILWIPSRKGVERMVGPKKANQTENKAEAMSEEGKDKLTGEKGGLSEAEVIDEIIIIDEDISFMTDADDIIDVKEAELEDTDDERV